MRSLLTIALICSAPFAWAEDATDADDPKVVSCQAQASIVTQAASLRSEGKRERKVKRLVTEEMDEAMKPAVPLLVGWVYTLPKGDLDKDPGPAYYEACLTQ